MRSVSASSQHPCVCAGLVVICIVQASGFYVLALWLKYVGLAVMRSSVAVLLVICTGFVKADGDEDAEICAMSCLETTCNGTTRGGRRRDVTPDRHEGQKSDIFASRLQQVYIQPCASLALASVAGRHSDLP